MRIDAHALGPEFGRGATTIIRVVAFCCDVETSRDLGGGLMPQARPTRSEASCVGGEEALARCAVDIEGVIDKVKRDIKLQS